MKIVISYFDRAQYPKALNLAQQLKADLVAFSEFENQQFTKHWDIRLNYNHLDQLELQIPSRPDLNPIFVELTAGKVLHRIRFGGGRKQPLARAMGLHKEKSLTVVDATAGLGTDGFILACLGAKVIMLERNPIMIALLQDGLARAHNMITELNLSILLIPKASQDFLNQLDPGHYPQVIYLDPMFPDSNSTALVKKEMQYLRFMVGKDEDAEDLLATALKIATERVVVKRPKLANAIVGPNPSFQLKGKSNRFDIYLTREPN